MAPRAERDIGRSEFLILNKQRTHPIDRAEIRKFVSRLVADLRLEHPSFSIVFIADEAMREYNRTYRRFDKPTDVLSFAGEAGYLGDILISSETAYNQAIKSSKLTFQSNIHRLIVHGLLHLMGYDHETDNGEMRAIERRLRRRFQC
jgi:probable rRNA maturation factor